MTSELHWIEEKFEYWNG